MYVRAAIFSAALDNQEFSYLLKRKAEILRATHELKPFYIPLFIDPVSSRATRRCMNQTLLLIEADRVYAQTRAPCDLPNLHLAFLAYPA
jgi:hypothetical protein